jgi:nitroreductase
MEVLFESSWNPFELNLKEVKTIFIIETTLNIKIAPLMKKPAITEQPIHPILADRWSSRAYDPSQFISQESLLSLMEAARWSPSCMGEQPWQFIVFQKKDATAWTQALNCLSIGNQNWAMDASILVLACAHKNFSNNEKSNRWSQYDTGAACENICLQATSMGLVAHQMGGFDVEKTRQLFQIPSQYDLMSFIAIGYPLAIDKMSEASLIKEKEARKRKPLREIFFINQWGEKSL